MRAIEGNTVFERLSFSTEEFFKVSCLFLRKSSTATELLSTEQEPRLLVILNSSLLKSSLHFEIFEKLTLDVLPSACKIFSLSLSDLT